MRFAAQAVEAEIEDDLNYRVWHVQKLLDQAARGGDSTAWALSSAMEIVAGQQHARRCRISELQRDELLLAIVRAQLAAIEHLPESYRREQIDIGMRAFAGHVMLWAETRERSTRSTRRSRDALADIDDYARMFRNDLHNIALREEIDLRAQQRHSRSGDQAASQRIHRL
jgi:hypothetical protein